MEKIKVVYNDEQGVKAFIEANTGLDKFLEPLYKIIKRLCTDAIIHLEVSQDPENGDVCLCVGVESGLSVDEYFDFEELLVLEIKKKEEDFIKDLADIIISQH